MKVPKLVFQIIGDNNEVEIVSPDQDHVFAGDFDKDDTGEIKAESSDIPNENDIDKEIERNICSISDIYDYEHANSEEEIPMPSNVGRQAPEIDETDVIDNICSISSLQDDCNELPTRMRAQTVDNVFSDPIISSQRDQFEEVYGVRESVPSISDVQQDLYDVNKPRSMTDERLIDHSSVSFEGERPFFFKHPLESAVTLQSPEEEDGGIWFKSYTPNDTNEEEDLTKQCDKIFTYESEFALPKTCIPLVEKERQNRSFGEKDFQRHRKDQSSSISAFNAFSNKHHKSHKHKHSRKDKTDGKSGESNDKLQVNKADLPKRPRSATYTNTNVFELMPLPGISEKSLDLNAANNDFRGMKRSKSLILQDTKDANKAKEVPCKEIVSKDKHNHHRHHHRRHHHARHLKNKGLNAQDTLESRIRSGMHALEEERKALREIVDEIETFGEKDREDITSHRFGNLHRTFESTNLRPHRHHRSGMLTHLSDMDTVSVCSFRPTKPHMQIEMEEDRVRVAPNTQLKPGTSSHKESGFVELEELTITEGNALQWKERARWIKFEEDVEKNERWGKPHVASLSFQSLLELRKGLETGTVLLNLDNFDLPTIFESIVENLIITDQINLNMREKVKSILLSKHCHHHQNKPGLLRRKPSVMSMTSLDTKDSGFDSEPCEIGEDCKLAESATVEEPLMKPANGHTTIGIQDDWCMDEEMNGGIKRNTAVKFAPITEEPYGPIDPKSESDVKERIPSGAEATSVLVATIEDLERTAVAFVRLSKGCFLGNLTEVSIPVRFLFVIMGPPSTNHDYFEIGRSVATLMSDKIFHDLAYSAKSRDDILAAINSFLDDSIVLAPGDWDRHLLLPLLQAEISEKRRERIKLLKQQAQWEDPDEDNPLERTGKFFGGLRREIVRKAKFYKSDFADGFNIRCLISIIFVFFATFAPTITFGALLEKKTKGNLGVVETLLATSFSGVLFGMTSGQPLMIVGTTGPILVFEEATFNLSHLFGIDFLKWRLWIGVWVMLICWAVVAFEGCILVENFTRFTEEVFSVLISLLFVYEAISFLIKTFKKNPLLDYELQKQSMARNFTLQSNLTNITSTANPDSFTCSTHDPNVALISTLLLLGTFYIAYYLRKLRVSHFLSSKARRVLSDFGVPFAMVFMVALNIISHDVSHVPKLKFKDGIQPTRDNRDGYIISPMGLDGYYIAAAFLPALCVSILLFMETELTGVLLNKRKNKLKKGGGYNLDLVVMGLTCGLCSIFGLPWMCAATVRSVQHQNALAVMSRSHAPGEKPYLLRIHEQRLTNICIHILMGISIVAYPLIEEIPLAVCYGVFLYLGFSSLSGIQFIEQLKLIFVPSKYHPNRKYIRNVTYRSLLWYTMIQMFCLILLIVCKLSPGAPAFPFIIIGMVFLRRFIERYFCEDELEDLDNEDDGDFDDFDEYGVTLPC